MKKTTHLALWLCLTAITLSGTAWAGIDTARSDGIVNDLYAAPMGLMPDARIENGARFGFTYELDYGKHQIAGDGATLKKKDDFKKVALGGYFEMQIGKENVASFRLSTSWKRLEEDYALYESTGVTSYLSHQESEVTVGLHGQFRLVNRENLWLNLSVSSLYPIPMHAKAPDRYTEALGLQLYYLEPAQIFGLEFDVNFLADVVVPEKPQALDEEDPAPTVKDTNSRQFVPGFYARMNFLFRIAQRFFIHLQVDDTYYIHTLTGGREKQVKAMYNHSQEVTYNKDRIDLLYYADHRMNVGLGFRVNLKVAELGIGYWEGVTQRDRRPPHGGYADLRVTF